MNDLLIESLVDNAMKSYSKTPIQETLSKLSDVKLDESNVNADIEPFHEGSSALIISAIKPLFRAPDFL